MTNKNLDNNALIQGNLVQNESTKPKLSLSEFLANESLIKNSNDKYVPNNQQLKSLVCYDEINLGDIDTSKITNMKDLFKNSTRQDFSGIDKWNVDSVTTFMGMFEGAENFNEDISQWNVSNATNFMQMFWNAKLFNQPIGKWKTTKATNTIRMFCNAKNFNQPLQDWDMSSVEWTWEMFAGAVNFNQPLDKWNISNVKKMQNMFSRAESFNQDLSAWGNKLGKAQNMKRMFADTKSLNQTFAWKLNENCDLTNITKGSALKLEISFIDDDSVQQETLQDSTQSSEKYPLQKRNLLQISKILPFIKL